MVTLEQVELLRSKADVTYEEARQALEATGGDLLDAVVLLEIQGKVRPPKAAAGTAKNNGTAPTGNESASRADTGSDRRESDQKADAGETKKAHCHTQSQNGTDFGALLRKFGRWVKGVVQTGNRNNIIVSKGSQTVLTLPITALVILMVFFFWAIFALVVIGMFTGFRLVFSGPDIRGDTANTIMNSAADAAESLKRDVGSAINKEQKKDSDEQKSE